MAVFPQLERIIWFDRKLKRRRFPNAAQMAERFEISHKTAQRDICRFRDRFRAPIDYDSVRRGYYYTEETFELPRLPITQEEILSVLIARHLLSQSDGGFISEAMFGFARKLQHTAAALGLDEGRLQEAFSASSHGYSPAPEQIFRTVTETLLHCQLLEIDYHSAGADTHTRRVVEPHHLQYYMASWVLIAYCRLRQDWRKFYLSRMKEVQALSAPFTPQPRAQWECQLGGAFGIFQGTESIPVTLRFNAFRARWIRQQIWHPAQIIRPTPEGGVELTFPAADFREVKMIILQFGADVEVVSPESLRGEIGDEIARMGKLYR